MTSIADAPRGIAASPLVLPRRFERLEQLARGAGAPIENLVRKVPEPTRHMESLLRSVRDQGLGRFEFILGLSGSGKTTFLRTLPTFFSGAPVFRVPHDIDLRQVPGWLEAQRVSTTEPAIFVLYDRDNPDDSEDAARAFFEGLRVFFRGSTGGLILVWPITDRGRATSYAQIAWDIGRDSVVESSTKGIYHFTGLDRAEYYDTADTTTLSLNGGRPLEAFGLTRAEAAALIPKSETISEFYSHLEVRSAEINASYGDLLKERIVPRVWILLAGDDAKEVYTTVSTLTRGVRGEVDVARLVSYLDDPSLDAAYLQQWKKIREKMVYLLTLFDVRVFGLYANVCVGAVRAFGAESVRKLLETTGGAKETGTNAIAASPFFKALLEPSASVVTMPRDTEKKTAAEYLRLQATAAKDDKSLNKALAECLKSALEISSDTWSVECEKQNLPGSNLQPDVQAQRRGERIACLEVTWRTTGEAIEGVRAASQNTLTTGHIQQYLLQKVLTYVGDFKL